MNESPITFEDPRCPYCGSDDLIEYPECGCCATCENCGYTFLLKD